MFKEVLSNIYIFIRSSEFKWVGSKTCEGKSCSKGICVKAGEACPITDIHVKTGTETSYMNFVTKDYAVVRGTAAETPIVAFIVTPGNDEANQCFDNRV